VADFEYTVPYGSNLIDNPTADNGITDWDEVSGVTTVDGGVDEGNKCFKFVPTASMEQKVGVPGTPPDVELGGYFLPGRDIRSAAKVKAEIVLVLHYGDGSVDRYVIPGKTLIKGY